MDEADDGEDSADDMLDERVLRAVAAAPAIDFGQPALPAQTIVAHSYELHRVIGAGAMGVVYEATDLVLLRRVAVKVHEIGRSDRAARMWREARAMAKLSDPNVVAIHEVGVDGSRGFIAMELVDGTNAREWVRAKRRDWREVIEIYRQAGRGLAAAHAVGIIHRDFKPDNMLVSADGRAKVADFGLAVDPHTTLDGSETSLRLDDRSTRTGATMGTPAYMAPEQRHGNPADARSDQYAYCVALFEALHGTRPGSAVASSTPTASAPVPSWIDEVLARGLADDPNRRHADMARLVAALDPGPRGRRRSAQVIAGALVVGSAALVWAGGWLAAPPERTPPCTSASAAIDPTWSEPRKSELEQAFAERPQSLATSALAVVVPGFDAWSAQWREAAHESCEATHVIGQQSMARLDARNDCLERARRRFATAIELLERGDVDAMTRAEDIVGSLPDVAMCARLDAALDVDVVPPERREIYDARLAALDGATADTAAGRDAAAKATLDALVVDLEADGFDHVLAEARRLRGDVLLALGRRAEAIAELGAAVALRHGAGDRDALATAMSSLARALGRASGGSDEALRVLAGARALAEDLQWSASRRLGLKVVEFEIAFYTDRFEDAERLADELLGDPQLEPGRQVRVRSLRAATFERRGRFADALAAHDETLALVERLRGPDHPEIASVLGNRATTLWQMTRHEEARQSLLRALAIRTAVNGDGAPVVGELYRQLGDVENARQEFEAATAHYERAIEIHRAANDDTGLSLALVNLSIVRGRLNDHVTAGRLGDEAIVAGERAFGPDAPQLARLLVNRGDTRFEVGELAQGVAELERALAILVAKLPADDLSIATTRLSLSRFFAQLGRADEAIALYQTGMRTLEARFSHDRPRIVSLAWSYAVLLDVAGRPEEALQQWRSTVAFADRTLAADDPTRAELTMLYGLRLLEAHEYRDARRILEAARELNARLGADVERARGIEDGLARARRGR